MSGHIGPNTIYISTGVLFAFAIITAIIRTAIRSHYFRKVELDDGFFLLAVATLIGGTTLLYINVPSAFTQQEVMAGLQVPSADFLQQMLADQKVQQAATVLLAASIVTVKFAFLFFFRKILERTNKRYVKWWWWVTLIIVFLGTPIMVFNDFIACPYTGEKILTQCTSPSAMARENAVLKASTATDIVTDAFIISIPALILKNLSLSVHKKLSLAAVLCLSVFMIICAVVKLSLAWANNGQVNTLWLLLWLELEACVAVVVISVSAFKLLYTETKKSAAEKQNRGFWTRAGSLTWLLSRRSSSNASSSERMGSSSSEVVKQYRDDSVDTLGEPVTFNNYIFDHQNKVNSHHNPDLP